MKKLLVLYGVILLAFILAACDPNSFYYDLETLKQSTIRIELINYDNSDSKTLFNQSDKVLPFDFTKMQIIETLNKEQIEKFLQELSEIHFLEYWKHSDSPKDTSVRIVYENGDFEVISYKVCYAGSFDSKGNVKHFVGGLSSGDSLLQLINDNFDKEVKFEK